MAIFIIKLPFLPSKWPNKFNRSQLEKMRSETTEASIVVWKQKITGWAKISYDLVSLRSDHVSLRSDRDQPLTSFTGSSPVASASAVADEAVPAVLAHRVVLAGVAVTLLGAHSWTGGLDACRILHFRQLPDVLAAPVNEQVTDAAHIAVVEHGSPEFRGKNKASSVLWQPAQIHVTLQVQDFTLTTGGERRAPAVHRYGTWSGKQAQSELKSLLYFRWASGAA